MKLSLPGNSSDLETARRIALRLSTSAYGQRSAQRSDGRAIGAHVEPHDAPLPQVSRAPILISVPNPPEVEVPSPETLAPPEEPPAAEEERGQSARASDQRGEPEVQEPIEPPVGLPPAEREAAAATPAEEAAQAEPSPTLEGAREATLGVDGGLRAEELRSLRSPHGTSPGLTPALDPIGESPFGEPPASADEPPVDQPSGAAPQDAAANGDSLLDDLVGGAAPSNLDEAAPPPARPQWPEVLTECLSMATAKGVLLAGRDGMLVADVGQWPAKPEAIAAKLVPLIQKAGRPATEEPLSIKLGANTLSSWQFEEEGELLTAAFLSDSALPEEVWPRLKELLRR